MKWIVFACLLFICSISSPAQIINDSCSMKVSLLTCAPGKELYSIFGHTAIRIQDSARGMDIIYNYGTFDDNDPLFYIHFTRGIMLYSVSAETLDSFMMEYEYEHRNVMEQVLNLNCKEKYQLYESLRRNTLDENRLYQYHFHTDNCTTRAGRMIESNTSEPLVYKNILPNPGPSFRDMIHEYLDPQKKSWAKFGIDMLLGKNLDIKPSNVEAIHFLPDYLYRGMESAYTGSKPVVIASHPLQRFPATKPPFEGFTTLAFFQCLILANILLFIFKASPAIAKILLVSDIIFFSLLGLVGILIAFLWLGRVDDVCRNNINILWAIPTHLVAVFFIRKKTAWIKYYFLITAILATLLLVGFPWWQQRMNTAVLPVLGIIIFRSFHLFQSRNHAEKSIVQR